jgi:methyl-accepting chemotaxis protein
MADWPDQPSLPAGLPYGYVTPPSYGDIQGFSSPFTAQQIDALRIKFQEALMQIIVLAVNGFFDAGEAAFDQLAAWAQQLGAAANSAADLIADLLDSLLGTGHTISDLVDYFQGIANDASNSINYIGTLIAGLGGTVIADVVTVITDVQTNSGLAVSQLAALITGVGGDGYRRRGDAINNGVTALTRIASLIAGVSGASTITDVVNSINAATTKLSALISGVSPGPPSPMW